MRERLVVVWRVTTRCNLACPFCACDRTLARPRPEADPDLIARAGSSLARWSEMMRRTICDFPWLCRELASWGIREITCNQLGGADRPEFFPTNRLLPEQIFNKFALPA